MVVRTRFLSFCVLFLAMSTVFSQKQLKRRGFIGMAYRPIKQADVDSMRSMDRIGLIVQSVLPGTPAEKAGILAGDVLKRLDAHSIADESQFRSLLRLYYAGDPIHISLVRKGHDQTVRLVMESLPTEKSDSLNIEYTAFPSESTWLRGVVASPRKSIGKKLPALMLVNALGGPQLIGTPFYSPERSLAYAAASAGFRVLRFELRGSGDSEGEDYRKTDFDTEAADNLAALDYLAGRPDVDSKRVFVYGHSTGGMEAAILAGRRILAGLVVSCTIGRTYFERLTETVRLQNELAGRPAQEIDRNVKRFLLFTAGIATGDSLSALVKKNPEFSSFINSSGRIMDDRNIAFWRQQLNLNLPELYGSVQEPVLVLYGASDFLTRLACHEHIRDVLIASGNRDVTLSVVDSLDHSYAFAKDVKESWDNYRSKSLKENPEAVRRIVGWLVKHAVK